MIEVHNYNVQDIQKRKYNEKHECIHHTWLYLKFYYEHKVIVSKIFIFTFSIPGDLWKPNTSRP